jgi:proteasome regulatory subunit
MRDSPEVKREYLGDDFSEQMIREIQEAASRNQRLRDELQRYNRVAEQMEDPTFYRERLQELYQKINSEKFMEVRKAMSQHMSDQSEQSGDIKTPVLKGVVVSEYDGKWIWIEPESAIKGQYGVLLPEDVDPDALPVGTELAVDPQTFEITDVLTRTKDAKFEPATTNVTFSDIGGLDNIIEILKKNIGVQLDDDRRHIAEQWGLDLDKNILLMGRPGTGKTMLAKALANEFDAEIFTINAPRLVEKFIGEGAKKIKKLYSQASSSDKPAIVFIDEIDAIAKSRDENRRHGGEEVERTMSQLLSELDGLDKEEGRQNIVSIFATNNPTVLDPAIINRCSALEVPVPDNEAKVDIFKIHTRKLPLTDGIDFTELVEEIGEDYTGRDISQVCKQAAISALSRADDVDDATVMQEDFADAIAELREGKAGMENDFLFDRGYPGEIFA